MTILNPEPKQAAHTQEPQRCAFGRAASARGPAFLTPCQTPTPKPNPQFPNPKPQTQNAQSPIPQTLQVLSHTICRKGRHPLHKKAIFVFQHDPLAGVDIAVLGIYVHEFVAGKPYALNPKPQTLNPRPLTLNPKPQIPNPKC